MELQKLILLVAPAAYLAGAAYALRIAAPAQRRPLVMGWLVPGLGHWVAGLRPRAVFFAVQFFALFVAGLAMTDFRCISPFDRHPIWALIQTPGGVPVILVAALTQGLRIAEEAPYYAVGCLYASVACLLNLVALCDLYDLTEPAERRARRI